MGLKNGGATCYMNAVFQQLFMQPSIRALVLGAREEPAAAQNDSPFFQLQARVPLHHAHPGHGSHHVLVGLLRNESPRHPRNLPGPTAARMFSVGFIDRQERQVPQISRLALSQNTNLSLQRCCIDAKAWTQIVCVCHLQRMFGHLALSHEQWYRPLGFWRAFKDYDGEPLNVREHQDAYEFFTRLQVGAGGAFQSPASPHTLKACDPVHTQRGTFAPTVFWPQHCAHFQQIARGVAPCLCCTRPCACYGGAASDIVQRFGFDE